MASLPFVLSAAGTSVFAATATKGGGSTKENKSFVHWLLGSLSKDDQFFETDPILNKVDDKSGTTSRSNGRKGTVAVQNKKNNGGNGGGFGGLFAKKQ